MAGSSQVVVVEFEHRTALKFFAVLLFSKLKPMSWFPFRCENITEGGEP